MPQRLRIVAARIVNRSLARYRPLILPPGGGTRLDGSPVGKPAPASAVSAGEGRALWHSGNMFGMQVSAPLHTRLGLGGSC